MVNADSNKKKKMNDEENEIAEAARTFAALFHVLGSAGLGRYSLQPHSANMSCGSGQQMKPLEGHKPEMQGKQVVQRHTLAKRLIISFLRFSKKGLYYRQVGSGGPAVPAIHHGSKVGPILEIVRGGDEVVHVQRCGRLSEKR